MKKILFFIAFIFTILSCSKEEPAVRPTFNRTKIVGSVFEGEKTDSNGNTQYLKITLNSNDEADIFMKESMYIDRESNFKCSYTLLEGDVYIGLYVKNKENKIESIGGISIDNKGKYMASINYILNAYITDLQKTR